MRRGSELGYLKTVLTRIQSTCSSPLVINFGFISTKWAKEAMKPIEISIVILSVIVVLTVQNPLILHNDNSENYYGGGHHLDSSFEVDYTSLKADSRLASPYFFTFTVILSTVTSVTTLTSTTTCTTSTASLSACSASGRRRRDLEIRSEFLHNEKEESNGRISLSPSLVQNEEESGRPEPNDSDAGISLEVESSLFNNPSAQKVRLSHGTSTVTQSITKTSTVA